MVKNNLKGLMKCPCSSLSLIMKENENLFQVKPLNSQYVNSLSLSIIFSNFTNIEQCIFMIFLLILPSYIYNSSQ